MAKAEIIGFDCEANATEGVKLILLAKFDEMCGFREAALDFSDIEGVHDMRVASRRLRSALKDFLPFMRKRALKNVGDELKKIADALGAVRDQDVAINALESLRKEIKQEEIKTGIEKLVDERNIIRDNARIVLAETIRVETLSRLREKLNQALEKAVNKRNSETVNFHEAANKIIETQLSEFVSLSESLYRPFKVKQLHELRITAKRLRYAIELFTTCINEKTAPFAKEVARMQDSLGDLHDCDVWIEESGKNLDKGGNENEREAAIWLLSHFVKLRTKHYRAALERWDKWQQSGFVEKITAALNVTSLN